MPDEEHGKGRAEITINTDMSSLRGSRAYWLFIFTAVGDILYFHSNLLCLQTTAILY